MVLIWVRKKTEFVFKQLKEFIPQIQPLIPDGVGRELAAYIDSGGWITEFRKTREFEEQVADFVGSAHAVAVTSGTVALYLVLKGLGVGPGDKVFVPNYTMIATINAVIWVGASPILVDIEPETFCLDHSSLVVDPSCKALIYVSINGRHGDLRSIRKFCDENGLALVEDAAQAMGAKYESSYIGTYGIAGIYSFSPHKIITTGQGGMVVTDDAKFAQEVRQLKDFYRSGPAEDWHNQVGYNFKFTDLQAVLGIEQMKEIDYRVERKKEIFRRYVDNLEGVVGIEFLQTNLETTPPWFVDVIVDSNQMRDNLINILQGHNIGSRPFYPPINHQPIYSDCIQRQLPVSEKLAPRGIWLPSSLGLLDSEIDEICDVVGQSVQEII